MWIGQTQAWWSDRFENESNERTRFQLPLEVAHEISKYESLVVAQAWVMELNPDLTKKRGIVSPDRKAVRGYPSRR
jgi:hypothetical protein